MGRRRARPGRHERKLTAEESPRRSAKRATLVGELKLHRDGYGFVIADKPGVEDVFVPARFIGDALHTDLVEVRVAQGRGAKLEGRITDIVERRVKKLVGRLESLGKGYRVIASDSRIRRQIKVHPKHTSGADHGDEVIVVITAYPEGDRPMQGVVEKVIEGRGNLDAEEEVIITHHQLPTHFPSPVEESAQQILREALSEVEGPLKNRRDLTHIPFVTIDGESAQDFDDAVAADWADRGIMRLWVSIADVSHFVRPGSAVDEEAYRRGTSVYFPQRCLPMLPPVLSNDLCSLRPDVPRLTVTAELDIDPHGRVVRSDFYRSIIKSRRRMTYAEIKKILIERDEATCAVHRDLIHGIHLMQECFRRLNQARSRRGSLDFDLPEPEIIMDIEGGIDTIVKAERHVGHMMIEEFMIAANEAVAEALTEGGRGCIYRVHEPPAADQLREFAIFAHNLGLSVHLGKRVPPARLAHVIEQVRGRPEERVINHKLLRSMSQAVYSAENLGHYGLASTCYCHFTSPIRRYPDLVVHRLLVSAISAQHDNPAIDRRGAADTSSKAPLHRRRSVRGQSPAIDGSRIGLAGIAEHCSRRERIAMEAERQMAKLYAALFMRDRIGETFDGVVSHVTKFGFFVELTEYFIEGVVRAADMPDDVYRFDERGMRLVGKRGKRIIRIGDAVTVRVDDVSIVEREIVFELLEHHS